MEFKIVDKKENPLLKREEADVKILGDKPSTPSRKEILIEASKTLGLPEDLIIVDKISTWRGKKEATAKLLIYSKKEEIPKYKIKKMEKRMGSKQPEPPPAAPAAKPEKPAV